MFVVRRRASVLELVSAMFKAVVPVTVAVVTVQAALGHVVRHRQVPETFHGVWSDAAGSCDRSDKSTIVISAEAYSSSEADCIVEAVSETPGRDGAIYSARLQCSAANSPKKSVSDIIMRVDSGDRISVGSDYTNLKAYRRCPAAQPTKTQ